MDLAQLSIRVDAGSADNATDSLNRLASTAERADGANDRLAASNKRLEAANLRVSTAQSRLNALNDSGRATADQLASAQARLASAQASAITATSRQQAASAAVASSLSRQQAATQGAASSNDNLSRSYAGLNRSQRGSGVSTANLAAQFNDLAVTVQAGQSPLQIALQQGTQIGQVFTQVGGGVRGAATALKSAFAAVVSPINLATIAVIAGGAALTQWAFSSEDAADEAETLEDRISDLSSATDDYVSAIEDANRSTLEIVETYGSATNIARQFLQTQQQLAEGTNLRQLGSTVSDIAGSFGDLSSVSRDAFERFTDFQGIVERTRTFGVAGLDSLRSAVSEIQEQFGLTTAQSLSFAQSLNDLRSAQGPREVAQAIRGVQDQIEALGVDINQLSPETNQWVRSLNDAGIASARLSGQIDGSSDALSFAIQQANSLNDAIISAANSASTLAENSQLGLNAARARLQFRSDPVGLAGELAGQRFDSRVGEISEFDDITAEDLTARRNEAIAAARETASLNELVRELNESEREAARLATQRGRASVTASNSAANARRRELQTFEATLQRTQSQIDTTSNLSLVQQQLNPLLSTYQQSLTAARREQELLVAAQRSNIEVTPELEQRIRSLSTSYAESVAGAQQLNDQHRNVVQTQEQLQSSLSGTLSSFATNFTGGIRDGQNAVESLRDSALDAFSSIADQLIRIAAQNLVARAFGGAGGGGLGGSGGSGIGSLFGGIGSLFAGFFADGGDIPRGQFGIAGEAGPEIISSPTAIAGPARVTPISLNDNNSSSVNVQVVNNASGVRHEVQQMGPNEIRIIASEVVRRESPGVISRDMANANSQVSKSLAQNTNAARRR